jgi:hypothetical protein
MHGYLLRMKTVYLHMLPIFTTGFKTRADGCPVSSFVLDYKLTELFSVNSYSSSWFCHCKLVLFYFHANIMQMSSWFFQAI